MSCFKIGSLSLRIADAQNIVNVARVQSELCTKDLFFVSYEFSYEKYSEIFPEMFEPSFCASEKIPQNSRQISHQISLRKIKKKSPTSFCRSAGREYRRIPENGTGAGRARSREGNPQ